MKCVISAIIVFLFLPLISFAQEKQLPVDKVNEMQQLESLTDKLEQLKVMAESITKEKYYKCVKAFGNNQFCRCLADNLSVGSSFEDYIVIVTSTRDELNYKDLEKEKREIIDITYKTKRDVC